MKAVGDVLLGKLKRNSACCRDRQVGQCGVGERRTDDSRGSARVTLGLYRDCSKRRHGHGHPKTSGGHHVAEVGLGSDRESASMIAAIAALDEPAHLLDLAVLASVRERLAGVHRLHARKPAFSAASVVVKNCTFSGRARRAPQDGRQYTPVLLTE
jgi:hypothetical protein